MYLDSSPTLARRPAETPRRRGACNKPARAALRAQPARSQPANGTARRNRLDDAIVAQWLLDQVPFDHRHALSR